MRPKYTTLTPRCHTRGRGRQDRVIFGQSQTVWYLTARRSAQEGLGQVPQTLVLRYRKRISATMQEE
jgi:hypothetical protein